MAKMILGAKVIVGDQEIDACVEVRAHVTTGGAITPQTQRLRYNPADLSRAVSAALNGKKDKQ